MKLVVDANILFAALIKDSVTAELLFDGRFELYAPDFIIDEFCKYEEMILSKTRRTRSDFSQVLADLKEIITTVNQEEYASRMDEALSVSPDKKDVPYLALALHLVCAIWSHDKKLNTQKRVVVHSTEELLGMK